MGNFFEAMTSVYEDEIAMMESEILHSDRHFFSTRFEKRLNVWKKISRRRHICIGRIRLTRLAACILIAATILVLAGCGVLISKLVVQWNELNNPVNGTLDVTFDIDDPNNELEDKGFRKPTTPDGYVIVDELQDIMGLSAEYQNDNDNTAISYSQDAGVETMGLSINNSDKEFQETTINGWKGYMSSKKRNVFLIWSDGVYLYTLTGDCSIDILWQMAADVE